LNATERNFSIYSGAGYVATVNMGMALFCLVGGLEVVVVIHPLFFFL
jgi:hypothetical protein